MMHTEQKQTKRFVLTMRNQKGQVGIFVALIFQVIFVFFAMLVNVGLVVHHKINLQQSTDLAAYYGAMKQAEMMNVMAHVNFQIRQAWKLMAWRYRILGTFGIINQGGATSLTLPIELPIIGGVKRPVYQGAVRDFACDASAGADVAGLTLSDIPFMCLGHNGFGDWISAAAGEETFCKTNCRGLQEMKPFNIDAVLPVGTSTIFDYSMGASIQQAINSANTIVTDVCNKIGPITTQMLALYYGNYVKDTTNRKNFIWMLTKNLGLPEEKMLDIEGNLVLDGVKKTLQKNLTEANLQSMSNASITAFNGVKDFGNGNFAEGMMKEINFKRLQFFMLTCEMASLTDINAQKNYVTKSLYQNDNTLDAIIKTQLAAMPALGAAGAQSIADLLEMNGLDKVNTIGYEKNPWIQVYYGVKATSEPKIPFLPLAKVKLHAVSFAKPFGGTIGPRYFKTWEPNEVDSSGRSDWINRTDKNLPRRNTDGMTAGSALKLAREYFFNYSTHLGDEESHGNSAADNKGGLANIDIVSFYHTVLANKYGKDTSPSSENKEVEPTMGRYEKPQRWPFFQHWYHLASDITDPTYDPLAVDRSNPSSPKNTYMRDIELSVVSPNQFDVTYYSIEPDFWRNYVREKLSPAVIAKIASNANFEGPVPVIPLDFGHKGATPIAGIPTHFNVRNQMQVTHDLFKQHQSDIISMGSGPNSSGIDRIRFALDVLATKQSSVLTGWTFLNLTTNGFSTFPAPGLGDPHSMLFGTCDSASTKNPWSDSYGAPYDGDDNRPPAQGNCITGGRTGYSVKLISSDLLRSGITFENLGGSGIDGRILNNVPDEFFNF